MRVFRDLTETVLANEIRKVNPSPTLL